MTLFVSPRRFNRAVVAGDKRAWAKRWADFAPVDYDEGLRRDRYHWNRNHEPYWVRPALPGEYDGARLREGRRCSQERHALVIIRQVGGGMERLFLPLGPGVLSEEAAGRYGPPHWWQVASELRGALPESVLRDFHALIASGGTQ